MSTMFGSSGDDAEGGSSGFYSGGGYGADSYGYNQQFSPPVSGNMSPAHAPSGTGFEDEPPLLEELGINFTHIMRKTLAVLIPFRKGESDLHVNDDDLAGPLIFGVLLGFFLLLSGKVHFGYIYGVGATGSLGMYALVHLMSETGFQLFATVSVLGYCLLPMDILAALNIFLPSYITQSLAPIFILWCAYSASMLFVVGANLTQQRLLVAYPLILFYTSFAILTIF